MLYHFDSSLWRVLNWVFIFYYIILASFSYIYYYYSSFVLHISYYLSKSYFACYSLSSYSEIHPPMTSLTRSYFSPQISSTDYDSL